MSNTDIFNMNNTFLSHTQKGYEYGNSSCSSCGGGVDKLTKVTDANQHQTNFVYDLSGRLTDEADPAAKKLHYTYYDNGLVKEKYDATVTVPGTLLITYSYNTSRQLTKKQYSDGTPDTTFAYDSNGRLQTATNASISYSYVYYDSSSSDNGRLKSITDNSGRQIYHDQYNRLGQRRKVTILKGAGADERSLDYSYTDSNRPAAITANNTKTFTYSYDKLDRRETVSYPSGVTTTHRYDNLNRLTGIKHATSTATVTFANYSGFDKSGNRKNKSTPSGTESYTYDNIYRLTHADTPKGPETYQYENVGNRQSGPGPKDSAFAYDDANRMTHGRQFSYLHDNAGNPTNRTITTAPDKGWTMTWDLDNRLKQLDKVKKNSNGVIIESSSIAFKYDPFGRRIEKKLTTLSSGITKTTTWTYVYDADNIAVEIYTPPSGPVEKTYYTHGPGVDEHLALERNGSYYYYHADGLGSVTAITNASAAVVQSYSYDSFGVTQQTTGFRNAYMYTGREFDPEAGMYYYRARYYEPMEGRFIGKDPIGFDGGINVYAYTGNNPVNYIDPTGLNPGVGAIAAAAAACARNPTCARAVATGLVAIGTAISQAIQAVCRNGERQTPDQEALGDLVRDESRGGRRPVSGSDADQLLDWGREVGSDVRDDRDTDHWTGGPHIHIPGSGVGHIPVKK